MSEQPLARARRIVVKAGSALVAQPGDGSARAEWLAALADDIADLRKGGIDVVVVSSGAIALGRGPLGLKPSALRLDEAQAAAAAGQARLMEAWRTALARHKVEVAQILLTLTDTEDRRRYLNARATLSMLLRLGALPVVNENDTVATAEIRYGDNDRLAARVADLIGADTLILLSDIDGLYTTDPRRDTNARHIPHIHAITPEIEAMAGVTAAPSAERPGTGGMASKLAAARIATSAGCQVAITDGQKLHPLRALAEGARASWFDAATTPHRARKAWIAGMLKPAGALIIDDGAARMLGNGKSLLPAGVNGVEGDFEKGDAVMIRDASGAEIGRGLATYGAEEARSIMGCKSHEIEIRLGYRGRAELIHRDDLVLHGTAGKDE